MDGIISRLAHSENAFSAYGLGHCLFLAFFALLSILLIRIARGQSVDFKYKIIQRFLIILLFVQFLVIGFKYTTGIFDIKNDLPLHVCGLLPTLISIAIFSRSQRIFAPLAYLLIGGSSQSMLTPVVKEGFPHIEFFGYFIVHGMLVITGLYCIHALNYRITLKDGFLAGATLNILAIIMYPINKTLGSNYLYLMTTPDGDTLFNALGERPLFYLKINGLILLLILILYFGYFKHAAKRAA